MQYKSGMQDKAKYQTKTLQQDRQSRRLHTKSRYKNPPADYQPATYLQPLHKFQINTR